MLNGRLLCFFFYIFVICMFVDQMFTVICDIISCVFVKQIKPYYYVNFYVWILKK